MNLVKSYFITIKKNVYTTYYCISGLNVGVPRSVKKSVVNYSVTALITFK